MDWTLHRPELTAADCAWLNYHLQLAGSGDHYSRTRVTDLAVGGEIPVQPITAADVIRWDHEPKRPPRGPAGASPNRARWLSRAHEEQIADAHGQLSAAMRAARSVAPPVVADPAIVMRTHGHR